MRKLRLVAVVAAAVLLAGCQSPYTDHEREGGTTPEAAEQSLLAIDGVTHADYRTVEWHSPGEGGLGAAWGMDVYLEIAIDPDHSIADPAVFLDFLARTAWSVNDHYPKGTVTLLVTGGIAHYVDWLPAMNAVLGTDDDRLQSYIHSDYWREFGDQEMVLPANAEVYGSAFGAWPSEPVVAPAGLLLAQAPDYPTVPAVERPRVEAYTDEYQKKDCYFVSVNRTAGYDGPYPLPIELELVGDGVQLEATLEADDYNHFFCFAEGERPSRVTVHVRAEGTEWYDAVDVAVTGVDS